MAKGTRRKRGITQHSRLAPYPSRNETELVHQTISSKTPEKKDWEDATCSVCMECPHNAVLLLCSSHEKNCRPYMCGTGPRYSNCLDQYKKAYTKIPSSVGPPLSRRFLEDSDATELACPLCRGQVKGWTVVGPAREYLNGKKRNCMHHNCSFIGTYKELRKHVRAEHPCSEPREVDPTLERKWRRLEQERETEDVRSTVRSSTPGAVFFGDYVIEGGHFGNYSEDEGNNEGIEVSDGSLMSVFLFLQAFGSGSDVGPNRGIRTNDDDDDYDRSYDMSLAGRLRRQGRVVSGRSGRRRRRREGNGR